jgi:hypothetical protein
MEPVMSVQPRPWPQPSLEIVAAVAATYRGKRERPLPVMVRDQLGEWLSGEQFAGACGVRGKPGWPPSRLALVTIFQKAENLTDRQVAEAVRTRIDWKYALGHDLLEAVAGEGDPDLAAGGHIPQRHLVIAAAAGQGLAVRAEGHRVAGDGVPDRLLGGHVPQFRPVHPVPD